MPFYIANLTRQHQTLNYRLPEQSGYRTAHVRIGSQVAISGPNGEDLSSPEIDAIVRQSRKYGMISIADVERAKPFVGLCYSTDRAIKVDVIMRGAKHNEAVLVEMGKKIRQEAALAINQRIEHDLQENPGLNASLSELDMTVQEEEPDHAGDQLAEGTLVSREEGAQGGRKRRKTRRNRN